MICAECEKFAKSNFRTLVTRGSQQISVRFCEKKDRRVESESDACKHFKLNNWIWCRKGNQQINVQACISRWRTNTIGPCHYCEQGKQIANYKPKRERICLLKEAERRGII